VAASRPQETRVRTSNDRRVRRSLVVLSAVLTALVLAGPAAATTGTRQVGVWFVRNGEPKSVPRTAATMPAVVRALLAGPTPRERARGIGSAIPAGTPVLSVTLRKRVVTLDLGARFASGVNRVSLRDRVTQVVRTLRGVPGVLAVRLRIEGGVPVGLFPGYDLRRPVTEPVPARPSSELSPRDVQQLLADLGFMDPSGVTGAIDAQTQTAVLGFQKWAGLPRDGVLTAETVEAIERARRPEPARRGPGARIEVHLARQVAVLIRNGRVERVVHISSGAGGATPIGSFHVYRKERYSWSVPFKVWLPWASYFVGGVAFHEFGSVPTYAASHGCVRVNHYDAPLLYEFAAFGTPVDVFWETKA
jgi:hypothetical protein